MSSIAQIVVIYMMVFMSACNKDNQDDYTADFSYSYNDSNHVLLENKSSGEYYSMTWDFGNGVTETTTNKNESFEIYYPEEGDYEVSLRLTNYSGGNKTVVKTINIATTDLLVSFTAEKDHTDPNIVILTNITIGEYDSFKWFFRNKEIEDEQVTEAYFPFSGIHKIVLEVSKDGSVYSVNQSVTIDQDDPDYIDNLTLSWADEFDGPTVNLDNWTFETGAGGWGNNELQNYTDGDNAEIVDGILVITARKLNNNMVPGSYTSSRMVTQNKHEFQYGKMEIRAKLPSGRGIWPAIWMLGSNFNSAGWPACGEMDIMEYVGYEPNVVHSTVHTSSGSGVNGNGSSKVLTSCEEEFHIYGLLWTEEKLIFYTDTPDNVTHTYAPSVKTLNNWPLDQAAFFIMNVAVGGDWGGAQGIDNSIFPQSMEIDYVRVYQEPQ